MVGCIFLSEASIKHSQGSKAKEGQVEEIQQRNQTKFLYGYYQEYSIIQSININTYTNVQKTLPPVVLAISR